MWIGKHWKHKQYDALSDNCMTFAWGVMGVSATKLNRSGRQISKLMALVGEGYTYEISSVEIEEFSNNIENKDNLYVELLKEQDLKNLAVVNNVASIVMQAPAPGVKSKETGAWLSA